MSTIDRRRRGEPLHWKKHGQFWESEEGLPAHNGEWHPDFRIKRTCGNYLLKARNARATLWFPSLRHAKEYAATL